MSSAAFRNIKQPSRIGQKEIVLRVNRTSRMDKLPESSENIIAMMQSSNTPLDSLKFYSLRSVGVLTHRLPTLAGQRWVSTLTLQDAELFLHGS